MIGLAAGGVIATVLVAGLPLLVIASAADPADPACAESGLMDVAGSSSTTDLGSGKAGLGPAQLDHAAAIIQTGRARGIPEQGMVIALATALQESRLRVYANDGLGDDLAPEQEGIASSQDLPHEAVGTDHGSLGVFQQQWPWWGSLDDLMDPASSAGLFYDALDGIAGWEQLPVTVAAQRVQRSAYPDAYADDEPLARRLLADLDRGTSAAGVIISAASTSCSVVVGAGRVTLPLPGALGMSIRRTSATPARPGPAATPAPTSRLPAAHQSSQQRLGPSRSTGPSPGLDPGWSRSPPAPAG